MDILKGGEQHDLVGKDEAECCVAHRDTDGRPPLGFCSPECLRRNLHLRHERPA